MSQTTRTDQSAPEAATNTHQITTLSNTNGRFIPMKRTTLHRGFAAAAVLTLSMGLAACGDDSTDSGSDDPGTSDSSAPADDDADEASAGDQVFGDACSAIPTTGKGSFDGMVTDPVATAASNNPLLSTLVDRRQRRPRPGRHPERRRGADGVRSDQRRVRQDPRGRPQRRPGRPGRARRDPAHHVIGAKLDPTAVVGTQDTLNKDTVTVEGDESGMTVDGATVLCGNIPTANATVYVIDTVLMPPA